MAILGKGERVEGISHKAATLDWYCFRQWTDCPFCPAHLSMASRQKGEMGWKMDTRWAGSDRHSLLYCRGGCVSGSCGGRDQLCHRNCFRSNEHPVRELYKQNTAVYCWEGGAGLCKCHQVCLVAVMDDCFHVVFNSAAAFGLFLSPALCGPAHLAWDGQGQLINKPGAEETRAGNRLKMEIQCVCRGAGGAWLLIPGVTEPHPSWVSSHKTFMRLIMMGFRIATKTNWLQYLKWEESTLDMGDPVLWTGVQTESKGEREPSTNVHLSIIAECGHDVTSCLQHRDGCWKP